jgi:DNA polymerase-1
MDKKVFLAIDGNAIVHRAYHAYPDTLTTSEGRQVNAVYGFSSMLLKVLEEFNPEYIACAFDTKKPTFRHTQFPEYKAHRKPTDQSLIDQFPLVEEVLEIFNIPVLKKEGFEADDILGTFAGYVQDGKWSSQGLEMIIVTGDKDLLQLVDESVRVCIPEGSFKNLKVYNSNDVLEKFGFRPDQVTDYKAMVGDPSDNIPGVKGIGDKTALGLLQEYGDLDSIYQNISNIKPRSQKLLVESIEQAQMSKELATIIKDVDLHITLEQSVMKDFQRSAVVDIFNRYQFRSLLDKIPKSHEVAEERTGQMDMFSTPVASQENSDSEIDWEFKEVESLDIKSLSGVKEIFAIFLDENESEVGSVLLIGVVDNLGQLSSYLIPVGGNLTFNKECETYFYNYEEYVSQNPSTALVDLISTKIFDTNIVAHLISSGRGNTTFSDLVYEFTGVNVSTKFNKQDSNLYLSQMQKLVGALSERYRDIEDSEEVEKFVSLIDLDYSLKANISKGDYPMVIDNESALALAEIENRGLYVDSSKLETLEVELSEEISNTQSEIYESIGHEFNIASPKQLAEVLFDELELPHGRGKVGRSTRESVLKEMRALHPCLSMILQYRELTKMHGTYVTPFLEGVNISLKSIGEPVLKTNFKLTGTSSGRLSSHDPNMQNLPARGDWAVRFREIFIPRKGMKMMSVDYSQIEFRVMAHVSGDEILIDSFNQGRDIHLETAVRIFKKDPEMITTDERTFGKTINFGILYGQTKFGLSRMLGITHEEAEKSINNYFKTYKGVANYINQSTQFAQERGYVETFLGRRRYVPGLLSTNRRTREAAVREAINMPIQGGAADIMKLAMLDVNQMLKEKYPQAAFILLQVHDELVLEAKEDIAEEVMESVKNVMETVVRFDVPLHVSGSIGKDMSELK